jgi:hypothetical protein
MKDLIVNDLEKLTTTNLITVGATVFIVLGWFVNAAIQRRHEISKERFRTRILMLKEAIDLLNKITSLDTEDLFDHLSTAAFKQKFDDADQTFAIYGSRREIKRWKEFANLIKSKAYNKKDIAMQVVNDLLTLLRKKMRREFKV